METCGGFLCRPDERDNSWSYGGGDSMEKWRLQSHVSGTKSLAPGDEMIREPGLRDTGRVGHPGLRRLTVLFCTCSFFLQLQGGIQVKVSRL